MIIANFLTVPLIPAPFDPKIILENTAPVAHYTKLYHSFDGLAATYMWECGAGKFTVDYEWDETIIILEGSVLINEMRLSVGDVAYFSAGTSTHWNVESYLRKIAFQRRALPRWLAKLANALRRLKRF
jgi:hypothetical protein